MPSPLLSLVSYGSPFSVSLTSTLYLLWQHNIGSTTKDENTLLQENFNQQTVQFAREGPGKNLDTWKKQATSTCSSCSCSRKTKHQ